jgi:uracil-DNA glycosylase family protein
LEPIRLISRDCSHPTITPHCRPDKKYWLDDIPMEKNDARLFLPQSLRAGLLQLRQAAEGCRGCELYKHATQVVFGEGKRTAKIMLIGEQPGEQEDLQGRPFIGPAGKLLDRALADAKLNHADIYVTNAVKHFKWKPAPQGKRRLNSKPGATEIHACYPWLEREILLIKPLTIVCLGGTAGQALFGRGFKLSAARGTPIKDSKWARCVIVTGHPSAILRIPDHDGRDEAYRALVTDLRSVARP